MSYFDSLKDFFDGPRMHDPHFGPLRFVHIPGVPERQYWTASLQFPPTQSEIQVELAGNHVGPFADAKNYYHSVAAEFEDIMAIIQPELADAWQAICGEDLPANPFSVLRLSAISIVNAARTPPEWNLTFENREGAPLRIDIPLAGKKSGAAVISR